MHEFFGRDCCSCLSRDEAVEDPEFLHGFLPFPEFFADPIGFSRILLTRSNSFPQLTGERHYAPRSLRLTKSRLTVGVRVEAGHFGGVRRHEAAAV